MNKINSIIAEYYLSYNTYTFYGYDARDAVINGTTGVNSYVQHVYNNIGLNFAISHYHATVNGIKKAPHSFYGYVYGKVTNIIPPVC